MLFLLSGLIDFVLVTQRTTAQRRRISRVLSTDHFDYGGGDQFLDLFLVREGVREDRHHDQEAEAAAHAGEDGGFQPFPALGAGGFLPLSVNFVPALGFRFAEVRIHGC